MKKTLRQKHKEQRDKRQADHLKIVRDKVNKALEMNDYKMMQSLVVWYGEDVLIAIENESTITE